MSQPWDPNTGSQPAQPDHPGYQAHPPQPGYPQPGAAGGYQQPGYQPAGYPPPGYPPPGYGYPPPGYPPAKPGRPGSITAAAVLAFVQGGVVLVSGIFLLAAVSEFTKRVSGFSGGEGEAWAVTIAVLLSGVLLVVGGVRLLKGPSGVVSAGCVVSLAISIYFLIRTEFNGGVVGLALGYAVLPIIILCFALGGTARSWAQRAA
jgi:hypothetical protein